MGAWQAFHFVLPSFLGELLTLHRGNPAGSAPHMRTPAHPACPAPACCRDSEDTHVPCSTVLGQFLQWAPLSQCYRTGALTDKCTGRCFTPAEDPQRAGTRTYLTGSCMVCSHDQQWEKRWNMLSSSAWRDGVPLAPTKRAARRVPVLRPPAYALSPWRGASHPWVPHPTAHRCCLQPGTNKPSLGTNPSPPGNTPQARTPGQPLPRQPLLASQERQSASHPLVPASQSLLTSPLRSSCLNLIWI